MSTEREEIEDQIADIFARAALRKAKRLIAAETAKAPTLEELRESTLEELRESTRGLSAIVARAALRRAAERLAEEAEQAGE